ncbi:MAG: DUF6773 family protein [Clostridiaceae bacterium]
MKINSNKLDEMQQNRRNEIGNQAFLMLMYLLLIDAGFYGFGFRWISYPANIMIILSVCSGIYVVRLISNNAYVGPSIDKERPLARTIFGVIASILISAAMLMLLNVANISEGGNADDMAAPLLFMVAAIALIIAGITAFIKKQQNKNDRNE